MSIDRPQGGKLIFECDECGDQFVSDTHDFNEAWQDAKDQGWRAYKDDKSGGWEHRCPDCR